MRAAAAPVAALTLTLLATMAAPSWARQSAAEATADPPTGSANAPTDLRLDPARIAPSFDDAQVALERLDWLLAVGEATATALFRTHNRYATDRAELNRPPHCDDLRSLDLASRARLLGAGLRDAAQAARTQARRVERVLPAPTVRPLVDAQMEFRALRLLERAEVLERGYQESAVWHSRFVEAAMRRCPTVLEPAPGFDDPSPRAPDDTSSAQVAVVVAGPGKACPPGVRFGSVAVVPAGLVCYGDEACDCEPAPVFPAAVIGAMKKAGSAR